jgi:hypothetical protein
LLFENQINDIEKPVVANSTNWLQSFSVCRLEIVHITKVKSKSKIHPTVSRYDKNYDNDKAWWSLYRFKLDLNLGPKLAQYRKPPF